MSAVMQRNRPRDVEDRVIDLLRSGPMDVLTIARRIDNEYQYIYRVVQRLAELGRVRTCGWTDKRPGTRERRRALFEWVGGGK